MDFRWLVTLPYVACHSLANVPPHYKSFTLCLPIWILIRALRSHSFIFLYHFCSCCLHASKQITAQYSHHLALALGNCHGGFSQLKLLVHIWLKNKFAEWVLICLHLILDLDLRHFSQKRYKHPTTKPQICIPLANPKLALLLGKDLPYLLATEVSHLSLSLNKSFTVKYELSLPPLFLYISKFSF